MCLTAAIPKLYLTLVLFVLNFSIGDSVTQHLLLSAYSNTVVGCIIGFYKRGSCGLSIPGWATALSLPSATVVYLSGNSGCAAGTKWLPDACCWHR